ncbi:diguanylate cyclase (GGDEF) domain-containing protein [Klenkia soli]|uniref:Diguanylate cyclase (GGDEF) domain-containing protein n=1 Tax=Klenkia soli TaxID=1052260 RepID=A0A1H0PDZ5_9ACTN|nr:GGDEF domain-containing protein [Klenkia soli]SDP02836.1 diguanylate cyclase (GGDEF) domain-containing protein [Klenkia soli]
MSTPPAPTATPPPGPPATTRRHRWFGTRDPRTAVRLAIWVMLPAAVVQACFALFGDQGTVADVGSWLTVGALVLVSLGLARTDPHRWDALGLLALVPLGGAVVLSTLNWVTRDTSAAAQVFAVLPTLWAASQLRPVGAWAVAAFSGVTNAVLVLHLEVLEKAVPDAVFVAATLALATGLLAHAGDKQEHLVRRLREQATVDPLTGLVTRHVLDAALAGSVGGSAGHGTALVLVDVDEFKAVNDQHGHPVGDDALRHLGRVLRDAVRDGDAVVGRLGGDELAVLLTACPPEVAERRAHDLVAAVRAQPLPLADGTLLRLTVSVGVAQSPTHAGDVRTLYTAADRALYEAKRGGRDRAVAATGPLSAG